MSIIQLSEDSAVTPSSREYTLPVNMITTWDAIHYLHTANAHVRVIPVINVGLLLLKFNQTLSAHISVFHIKHTPAKRLQNGI